MKQKEKQIIYYNDELNDEFSTAKIIPKRIDANYKYIRDSLIGKFLHFFFYRVIATPLAFLYLKIKFHHKIVNKQILKQYKNKPYFIYGNHTQIIADALIPTFISMPKDVYIITHPNNVSMPFLGKINPYLGALPLPDDLKASKNFISAIEKRIEQNKVICIYPEAHIWPYYTKIRPFLDKSFHYPVKYNLPTFVFTNTYQKRKKSKGVNIVTYIDGPFYIDNKLDNNTNKKLLRDEVYNAMLERSKKSNIEIIVYKKGERND